MEIDICESGIWQGFSEIQLQRPSRNYYVYIAGFLDCRLPGLDVMMRLSSSYNPFSIAILAFFNNHTIATPIGNLELGQSLDGNQNLTLPNLSNVTLSGDLPGNLVIDLTMISSIYYHLYTILSSTEWK